MNRVDVPLDPDTVLARIPLVDEFTTDEGTVVMVGVEPLHRVVRLSPLGLEALDAIGGGTTLAELEDELRSRLGAPPGGGLAERVLEVVVALLSAEVISAGQGHKTDNGDDIRPRAPR